MSEGNYLQEAVFGWQHCKRPKCMIGPVRTLVENEKAKFDRRCEFYLPALLRFLIQAAPVSSSAERIALPSGCEMARGCGWGLMEA